MKVEKIQLKSGLSLAYEILGSGANTLVGLAGLGCDRYVFAGIKESLAQHFRLILIDNRGMGASSDALGPYEIEDLARDTLELLDQLAVEHFGVLGISMGGFITQSLIKLAGERLWAAALLGSTSGGTDFISLPALTDDAFRKGHALGALGHELAVKATVHPELSASRLDEIIELRKAHAYRLEQVILQNQAASRFLAREIDLSPGTDLPALIMHGREDRFVAPQNAYVLARKMRAAQVVMIERSDHLFFLERPQIVSSYLINFFQQYEESR